jgi:hypothetical protein
MSNFSVVIGESAISVCEIIPLRKENASEGLWLHNFPENQNTKQKKTEKKNRKKTEKKQKKKFHSKTLQEAIQSRISCRKISRKYLQIRTRYQSSSRNIIRNSGVSLPSTDWLIFEKNEFLSEHLSDELLSQRHGEEWSYTVSKNFSWKGNFFAE